MNPSFTGERLMDDATEQELQEARADHAWWDEIGQPLRLRCIAWTWRDSADFLGTDDPSVREEITGVLARRIRRALHIDAPPPDQEGG